jgi:type II secretory pathway pseudopilin PulG
VVAATPDRTRRRRARRRHAGFTYLGVLFAVAVLGIGLVSASQVWVTTARRHRTEQLEWIGGQFTQAIGSYYHATPGPAKTYPPSLQDLLEDRRGAVLRRHLRRAYRNPFTGRPDWEFVRTTDGRISGVRCAVPSETGKKVREFVYSPATGS